jgi:TonB family protein
MADQSPWLIEEGAMSSINSRKNLLLILGGILVLALMAVAAIRSGQLPNFIDPYGLLFVFIGGVALPLISFPSNEIRRALMHAVGAPGNNEEIRLSIFFWEAAGRGFWILGVLYTVLSVIFVFDGLKQEESAGLQAIVTAMARSQLGALYGILPAVICFIPCWKLIGKLQSRPSLPNAGRSEAPLSIGRPGLRCGAVIVYVLFFFGSMLLHPFGNVLTSIFYWPSLLVVLGGALALMLFFAGVNSRPPMSMSFAFMGVISILMALIQMLFGLADIGIARIASALEFVLSSCFASLLGIILVGAPLEDRAVRTGRVATPSALSRLSWYGFPLLTLIVMPLVIVIITKPLPIWYDPQHTEVSATDLEPRARYEARAPQSEPKKMPGEQFQKRKLIYKVNPVYPEQAKREGIQGTVKLEVIINEEGFVYEVKGKQENNPILEQAAIPAVKRWRFSPLLMNGMPVAIKTIATVDFASK